LISKRFFAVAQHAESRRYLFARRFAIADAASRALSAASM
jgi:hypothetical protein